MDRRITTAGLCIVACLGATTALAVPVTLYSNPGLPFDYPFSDDSKITNVTLTSVKSGVVGAIGSAIGSLDNPTPVTITRTFTFTETTGWEKTFSSTVSSSIGSELSTSHLIDANINSSIGASYTIGGSINGTSTRSDSITLCATCEKFDVVAYPLYTMMLGTVSWYQDVGWPYGFDFRSDDWSIRVFTGTKIALENYAAYTSPPCPVPVPPALPLLAGAWAIAALVRRLGRRPG